MTDKIVTSEFDGRTVAYIDPLKLQHSGRVVGRSPDGDWYYIQSDQPGVEPAHWHFRITSDLLAHSLTD